MLVSMFTVKKFLTALYFFSRKPQYLSVFWNETNKLCYSACSTDELWNTESPSLLLVPWSRALTGNISSVLVFDDVGNRSIQRESRRLPKNMQTTHRKPGSKLRTILLRHWFQPLILHNPKCLISIKPEHWNTMVERDTADRPITSFTSYRWR